MGTRGKTGEANKAQGRVGLRGSGSQGDVGGGGPPLQAPGPAGGLLVVGGGPQSLGGARRGMELRECDCRSGGTGTEDLLSTDGHAETRQESDPSGPERERWNGRSALRPERASEPRVGKESRSRWSPYH